MTQRSFVFLVPLFVAACGAGWPGAATVTRGVEPPAPPLRETHQTVLATSTCAAEETDCVGPAFIGRAVFADRTLVVWQETRSGEILAMVAELDAHGVVAQAQELPFRVQAVGRVGDAVWYVTDDERGARICDERFDCQALTASRRGPVSFGPRGVVLDAGSNLIEWRAADRSVSVISLGATVRRRAEPTWPRVGPCGDRSVIVDRGIFTLGGERLAQLEGLPTLVIVDGRSFAIPSSGRQAIDACTGHTLTLAQGAAGDGDRLIAAFVGRRGLATLRSGGSAGDAARQRYDYAGDTERLDAEAWIGAGWIDRRGRLWLATSGPRGLRIEIHVSAEGSSLDD